MGQIFLARPVLCTARPGQFITFELLARPVPAHPSLCPARYFCIYFVPFQSQFQLYFFSFYYSYFLSVIFQLQSQLFARVHKIRIFRNVQFTKCTKKLKLSRVNCQIQIQRIICNARQSLHNHSSYTAVIRKNTVTAKFGFWKTSKNINCAANVKVYDYSA